MTNYFCWPKKTWSRNFKSTVKRSYYVGILSCLWVPWGTVWRSRRVLQYFGSLFPNVDQGQDQDFSRTIPQRCEVKRKLEKLSFINNKPMLRIESPIWHLRNHRSWKSLYEDIERVMGIYVTCQLFISNLFILRPLKRDL